MMGEAGAGEGVMTDHKEDATCDAIERRCHAFALEHVEGYAQRTPAEQREWTYMARGYCVAHKCDNLCKNVMKGLEEYVVKKKYFKNKKCKEFQFCKGKQWGWAIHKCIGVNGPMVTDLNIYKDFYLWLEKRNRKPEMMFLQALGPQVGDRFWALFHNALQIYAMRESVVEFAEERKLYAKGINKKENNLIKTIREMGTALIPQGPFKLQQMTRVLAEV
jgi:hypothetical protein